MRLGGERPRAGLGRLRRAHAERLLQPDLTQPLTLVKLALVVLIGWNGVAAAVIQRWLSRVSAGAGGLSQRRLVACACSGLVSQLGWWGAMPASSTPADRGHPDRHSSGDARGLVQWRTRRPG